MILPSFRRPSPVSRYQKLIARKLARRFGEVEVADEWRAFSRDDPWYGPRLDVVVGPFATTQSLADEYDRMEAIHRRFLEGLWAHHLENLRLYGSDVTHEVFAGAFARNSNARCFIAIEIENAGSRKHLMGGALNAAALGRVALAVGWRPHNVRSFVRLRSYFKFLNDVDKPSFPTSHLLILSKDQLLESC